MARRLSRMRNVDIYNAYSNCVIIVDEAHELIPSSGRGGHDTHERTRADS